MPARAPSHPLAPLRGAARLAVDATTGVTDLVEAMHLAVGSGPAILGRPLALPLRILTAPVYGAVRGVTRAVGAAVDVVLAAAGAALPPRAMAATPALPGGDAFVAILNGVLGDRLAAERNPLARSACLVHAGRLLDPAAPPAALPSRWLLVLVHGTCLDERSFARPGQDLGAALAAGLGCTPISVRYNTGLHVAENGRVLAGLLEGLLGALPGRVDRITLLGHSMGGLVARSACRAGEEAGHAWRPLVRDLVTLGTPHQGAPLERAGHLAEVLLAGTPWTRPLARLGLVRSAGVTDLRHGSVLDHAPGRPPRPLPLPAGVACYAVAGSLSAPGAARPRGDGLVPVASAHGEHRDPARALGFPREHRRVVHGTGHIALLERPEVVAQLCAWLAPRDGRGA